MRKFLILGALLITGCATSGEASSSVITTHIPMSEIRVSCPTQDGGKLPDPLCTPGAIDKHVTQGNIHSTICVRGYTSTVRPPVSATNIWKKDDKRREGYSSNAIGEEDHLIALELGGAPSDRRNLWFEPGKIPNPKDAVENSLRHQVCAGKLTLAKAQHEISSNWTTIK